MIQPAPQCLEQVLTPSMRRTFYFSWFHDTETRPAPRHTLRPCSRRRAMCATATCALLIACHANARATSCSSRTGSRAAKSSSRSTARSRPERCSQQQIRPAQPRWSYSRAMRIRWFNALMGSIARKPTLPWSPCRARGDPACDQSGHAVERGDPGCVGSDGTPGGKPRDRSSHVAARVRIGRAGAAAGNPRAHPRRPPRRRPVDSAGDGQVRR